MAKSILKNKARGLRELGYSVKTIAGELHVSRSSVSTWVRDIPLTQTQLESLLKRELHGKEIGRIKSAEISRERRRTFIEQELRKGQDLVSSISKKELLIAGAALYWGEGSKLNGSIQFCNSDPRMIQFFLLWLEKCLTVRKEELTCWVGINVIHEERIEKVKNYWSGITGIPLTQFSGTSFKRVTNKKVYQNHNEHFGTLFIRVNKPLRLYYNILGMIEGLRKLPA